MSEPLPAWLLQSKSLDEAVARVRAMQAKHVAPALWKRLSLVSSFDASLYALLSRGLQAPDFAALADWANVHRVPEGLTLSSEARRDPSLQWVPGDPELRPIAASLAAYFRDRGDSDSALLFGAIANPVAGLIEFSNAYKAADVRFDLSRCAKLLDLLRTNYDLIEQKLRDFLNDREQYLRSRILFVDDYYRTVIYVDRPELAAARDVVGGAGPRRLNVYGKGGFGKTMLLQRLISHDWIPETSGARIPVARVDLDFVNIPLLADQPWLLLLEAAIQLQPQIVGGPFQSLIGPGEISLANQLRRGIGAGRHGDDASLAKSGEDNRDKITTKFRNGVGENAALLLIDTMEEIQLHYPAGLVCLLKQLMKAQNSCPNLRILFSGRYKLLDPKRPLPWSSEEEPRELSMPAVQIREFSPEQSRHYLTDLRHLPAGEVVEAIVKRSGGNPFELSLFAELAQSRPLLTTQDVEDCPDAKLAYLVERVIDRIPCQEPESGDPPEERVRKLVSMAVLWVLRYAVIPRDLTRDYLDNVLAPYVISESAGRGHDFTELPGIYADRDRWPREAAIREVLDRVWTALQSYASSYGWISEQEGVLHFQPEVVQPMRELLRQNRAKYPLFDEIHQSSWEYFEKRNNLVEAAYHRFEVEGRKASSTWCGYLQRARKLHPRITAGLADALLTPDSLEETAAIRLVSNPALEQIVRKAGAFARLVMWLRDSSRDPRLLPSVVEGSGNLLDASAALKLEDRQRVRELLTEHWIETLPDGNEQIAACLLLACVATSDEADLLDRLHHRAIQVSIDAAKAPWFPLYNVLGHAARRTAVRSGATAIAWYTGACKRAVEAAADRAEISQLLQEFGDLASAYGLWTQVFALALHVRNAMPAVEEASRWLLNCAIQFGDMEYARSLAWAPEERLDPVDLERQADLAVAAFRGVDAEPLFEKAELNYELHGYRFRKIQVQLKRVRMLLEQVGNVRRAQAAHSSITQITDTVQAAEYWRLDYLLRLRSGVHPSPGVSLMERRTQFDNLPPVYDAVFAATIAGASDEFDPRRFLAFVTNLDVPASRWTLMIPLAGAKAGAGRAALSEWQKVEPPPNTANTFLYLLGFLAGCRFFGDIERWQAAAHEAADLADPYLLVRIVPLLPPGTRLALRGARNFLGGPVWSLVFLAAAELASDSRDLLAAYKYLAQVSLPRLHCGSWRQDLLLARMSDARGNRELALKHLGSAMAIADELGDLRAVREMKQLELSWSGPSDSSPAPLLSDNSPSVPTRISIDIQDGLLNVGGKTVTSLLARVLESAAGDLYAPDVAELARRPAALEAEIRDALRSISDALTAPRCELAISAPVLSAVPWELAFDSKQKVTRSAIDSYVVDIPGAPPGPPRVMVLQDPDAERYAKRGYGVLGIRVADLYSREGAIVDSVSIQDDSWMTRMQALEPGVIHIASGFWDSRQPREVLLDMASNQSNPLSASVLAGVLERFGHLPRRPVVILDAVWDSNDGPRQVLLRNCFAGKLWLASSIRAVLAVGSYETNGTDSDRVTQPLRLIASSVARRATLAELHRDLRTETQPFLPPALFTNHPDARIV